MAAEGHPKVRLTEAEIDSELLALFASIRVEDAEIRQWFVDVIRARATLARPRTSSIERNSSDSTSRWSRSSRPFLRCGWTVRSPREEYAAKRADLHDCQSALRVQLEASDRDDREVAELAIKAFELSQSLKEQWLKANYNAKRTILKYYVRNRAFELREP